jgi:hypothetical protein
MDKVTVEDGITWMTVRCFVEIDVIADNESDAKYFAKLALPDYSLENYFYEVMEAGR